MRKLIKCLGVCLTLMILTSFRPAADENESINENHVESIIKDIYRQIDFTHNKRLPYEVFNKAYRGYINLRNEGKLSQTKQILSVCDFDLPSTENRLWIIDLETKKVLFNTYVAHGQGSGEDYAYEFSNETNSHQSSLGFYVTGDTYDGEHGTSLHLFGMDSSFNDAAYDRGIVVHGAEYVSDRFINYNDHLGRSWGCPAVSQKLSLPIINTIKDSTCLFIYYPQEKYLKTAYWLNKKISDIPGALAGKQNFNETTKPKMMVIRYVNSKGQVDSEKTVPLQQ